MLDKFNGIIDKVRSISRIISYGAKLLSHIANSLGTLPRFDGGIEDKKS